MVPMAVTIPGLPGRCRCGRQPCGCGGYPRLYAAAFEAVGYMVAERDAAYQAKRSRWVAQPPAALGALPAELVDYDGAVRSLEQLARLTTPSAKVDGLRAALKLLCATETSADALLPSFMFALLRASLLTPAAECAFILQFVHPSLDLNGSAGYSIATFECAIEAIISLPMDVASLVL